MNESHARKLKKVLMFSSDASILDESSPSRARMREYADLVDELHVVLVNVCRSWAEKSQPIRDGALFVWPTNSGMKFFALFDAYRVARRASRERNFSVDDSLVSSQDPFEMGFIAWMISRSSRVKLQLQVHTDFASPFFSDESFLNSLRAVIAKFLLPRANGVRVVSDLVARGVHVVCIKYGRRADACVQNVGILPIWVDAAASVAAEKIDLRARFPEFDFIVFMASRLTREKNILTAVEAIFAARKVHPNIGLVIAGDGPIKKNLDRYDFVRCLGFVKNVASHMKGADVFLNTSLYEGYGRTIVEAVAAGVPIISTDVGIASEFIKNNVNGFIVPVSDIGALVKALLHVADSEWAIQRAKIMPHLPQILSKEDYLRKYFLLLQDAFEN